MIYSHPLLQSTLRFIIPIVCVIGLICSRAEARKINVDDNVADAVDTLTSAEPMQSGDLFVGGRLLVGGLYGASFGEGLVVEYAIAPNMGVGGAFYYASYDNSSAFIGTTYTYTYTNMIATAQFNYHFFDGDIKGHKLDLFATANMGVRMVSTKWDGPTALSSASDSDLVLQINATARYYFSDNLAATMGFGSGLGFWNIGVDLLL